MRAQLLAFAFFLFPVFALGQASDATAADLGNGTIRVSFVSGPHNGDVVDFPNIGHVIIRSKDTMKGELKYGGTTDDQTKTQKTTKTLGNVLKSATQLGVYTGGRGAVLDPYHNWTIIPYVGGKAMAGINTELQDGSKGHFGDPNGLAQETLDAFKAATTVKADLMLPAQDKLHAVAAQIIPTAP